MKIRILFFIFLMLLISKSYADNINVASFDALIQSGSESTNGDTVTITGDLSSDESIGNSFYTKDLTFLGQNYSINGQNNYGGFVLSEGSNFDSLRILNFKGQSYNNSYFAGAIYNTLGTTGISNSAFIGNYADSQGVNFAVAGALYNMNNGTVTVDSSLFSNNYTNGASAEGGAIGNEAGANSMSISNSVFDNNYTFGSGVSYGGAIYNGNNANININGVSYEQFTKINCVGVSPGVFAQAPVVLWLPWRGLAEKGGWGLGWPDGLFCSLKRPVSACRMACFASLNSLFLQVPGHQRLMPEAKAVADAHEKAPHGAGLCMHGLWRWTCGGCRRGRADCRQAVCGGLLQPVGEPLDVGDGYQPAPLLY